MTPERYLNQLIEGNYEGLVAWLMLRYPQIANDAVHEAYMKLREQPIPWVLIRDPKAFLYTVALAEARTLAHRGWWVRRVQVDSELTEIRMDDLTADSAPGAMQVHVLSAAQAFQRLSPLQQDVYVLHITDRKSAREIAFLLNESPDRVERALTAARRAMKAAILNHHRDEP